MIVAGIVKTEEDRGSKRTVRALCIDFAQIAFLSGLDQDLLLHA